MTPRHALITGANKGIGLAVAAALLDRGFTVWLACRDVDRARAAAASLTGDARIVALDVVDDDSVAAAVDVVRAGLDTDGATASLDVVVNNAGIYLVDDDGPPATVTLAAMLQTFDVNVLGALRVTRALSPLLAAGAHVVNVGSGAGSLALRADVAAGVSTVPLAYSMSKTALHALTIAQAHELRDVGVCVVVVNPGYVATDLNGHSGTQPMQQAVDVVLAAVALPLSSSGTFLGAGGIVPW